MVFNGKQDARLEQPAALDNAISADGNEYGVGGARKGGGGQLVCSGGGRYDP